MAVQSSPTPRGARSASRTAQPKSRPVPPALIDQELRRDMIAKAAYYRAERRGGPTEGAHPASDRRGVDAGGRLRDASAGRFGVERPEAALRSGLAVKQPDGGLPGRHAELAQNGGHMAAHRGRRHEQALGDAAPVHGDSLSGREAVRRRATASARSV